MSKVNVKNPRIEILDGYRAIAIIAVMLFHYFSRYAIPFYETNLYPYGNSYSYFGKGYLGVEFFFIISGFVIFFTLENTRDIVTFWKKRMIRLWPSMFFASLAIFLFFIIFDTNKTNPSQHEILNFIPSITFIRPDLINYLIESLGYNVKIDYLNGSFWSLWVEVQFYFVASVIYFLNKKHFLKFFLFFTITLIVLNLLLHSVAGSNRFGLPFAQEISEFQSKWFDNGFDLFNYLPFFAIGVIFYLFYKNNFQGEKSPFYVKISLVFLIFFELFVGRNYQEKIIFVGMFALFFVFIYYPKYLTVLEMPPITKTGVSSYFLYLIHEKVGVFIIITVGSYFLPYGFVLPIIIIIIFTLVSFWFTYKLDKKINRYLKSKLLN